MTIGYGDLKKGMSIELDGEPYSVVDYERSKMQQRAPVMKIRFRNIKTGKVMDRTFSGYDVSFTPAAVSLFSSLKYVSKYLSAALSCCARDFSAMISIQTSNQKVEALLLSFYSS